MKSSISMKSWKTTISLSALLFLMFALTVLSWSFIGVSMPSSLSSPASPASGSITYDNGANVITVTGYSTRTPCTFNDVWNADKAGERVLMANASAVQDMNLTTQVAPTDRAALKLRFAVSSFVSNGFVNVTGTDKDGNAQTETNIAITANGNYSTSLWFATVSSKGLDCNGSFGIMVYQLQWGVVWKTGTDQYRLDCQLHIGTAVTATYFADASKEITFSSSAGAPTMKVWGAGNLTLGQLDDAAEKITSKGCSIITNMAGWVNLIYAASNKACVYLYSCSLVDIAANTGSLYFEGNTGTIRMYNCNINRLFISGLPSSAIVYNCYTTGGYYGFFSSSGTINTAIITKCTFPISMYGTVGQTLTDITVKQSTTTAFRLDSVTNDRYMINCNIDSWLFTFIGGGNTKKVYRQYTFDLSVFFNNNTALENANITLSRYGQGGALIGTWLTNSSGQIATQTLTMGFYNQTGGNTIHDYNPYNITITKEGYQTYTGNFTLSQKTNWTIALQPLTDGGLIEHVGFVPVDPGLTSPSGTYRWLDVADQAYGISYRNSYNYSQADVEVAYCMDGNKLQGLLKAMNLKPDFAYQLKLVGTPGTADNERIGLAGRWWQEEWTGTTWVNGQNLNDKGDGSSPNPNDQTYLSRRYIPDSSSPTGYHYRYTGYLVFDYFITDNNGTAALQFETGSCYHVIWKITQRSNATNDGPVKTVTFDPAPSQPAYDTDYPSNTVSIFGEWERLPMGQVNLQPGEYNCQIVLTEESFHGSGGTLAGNWAGAVTANIMFKIN